MREINADTAAAYLRESGSLPNDAEVQVRELSGGVSNIVMRVDVVGQAPFVIKQCRERLRVAMEWHARLDRIWAERATLELLGSILPPGVVPSLLFEDRPNYLFAMSCAPDDSSTWKARLMAGEVDAGIAGKLGMLLGTIHAQAVEHPILHRELADTSLFDELRVDPYYRTTARAHPDLAPFFDSLIAAMEELPIAERTLALGDFSPKNILVHSQGLILLDFECAHRGDPTFDLGFFLSHLVLKTIHLGRNDPRRAVGYLSVADQFWSDYLKSIEPDAGFAEKIVPRGIVHTAACLLARVDGKSPVEYLDEAGRQITRALAVDLLRSRPENWPEVSAEVRSRLTTSIKES
jgi:5-methylthioribose kinase